MLLRDERQMAVSAVETLCLETADHYAAAARRTDDAGLAQLFDTLAQQRRQLAAELAAQIRALDDLPQQPDPDREAVEEVFSGIKAFLSGDARAVLVGERERAEEDLAAAASAALRHAQGPQMHDVLRRILAHAEAAMRELAAVRP